LKQFFFRESFRCMVRYHRRRSGCPSIPRFYFRLPGSNSPRTAFPGIDRCFDRYSGFFPGWRFYFAYQSGA
jgi:hypothetical protein